MTLKTVITAGETPRYRVVAGSDSGHCCFEATVVDTTQVTVWGADECEKAGKPYMRKDKPDCEAVCECFDVKSAQLICDALNKSISPDLG